MIKEYISKDYLYSMLTPHITNSRGAEHYAYECIKQEIDNVPPKAILYVGVDINIQGEKE